jgi:hypothetical protein
VQLARDAPGLVGVTRPHVEQVAVELLPQRRGAGDRAEHHRLRLGRQRQDGRRLGGAGVVVDEEDALVLQQAARVLDGALHVEAVVQRLVHDAAAVHAAARVDRIEVQPRAGAVLVGLRTERAAQHHGARDEERDHHREQTDGSHGELAFRTRP